MSDQIVEITEAQLPQNLKTFWLKALSAVEMQNHTYAISLINAVLKDAPGFLAGRQLARKCAIQVVATSGKKKKSGGMTALLSGGMSSMKLANAAKKDPVSALIQIEKELEKDPFEPQVNDVLFDTAMRLNLLDTAAFALETVRKGAPENTRLMHKLAEHYLLRDKLDVATDVYNEIVKQDPGDIHAIKGSKDSSARASMKKQKWEDAQSLDELKKDTTEMAEIEASDRAAMTKDQQLEKLGQLMQLYQADQNNLSVVKDIARLYEDMEHWKDAHAFYDWAFQISNGDAALKLKAGQIGDRVANEAIKEIEAQLEVDPNNDELRARVESAKQLRAKESVLEAEKRVEQNPTDPQLRFELGSALYSAGQYSDAIPHLQQATRNPHIRTRVLLTLARAFDGKAMYDLAIKQLIDALADLQAMDTTKKEVLYEKGLIHEKMGVKAEALECFKQIYEVDYGYRDVAKRVESSYS
jgi:tetratricopeptide (TPR) repeat protein